jgi:predicted RNase H-like HicB family nuclease
MTASRTSLSRDFRKTDMERTVKIHIQKLPEGVYLATSDDIQGLVAQGRTVTETIEIARDVARKLIESQENLTLPEVEEQFDYPLIVG